jgi:pimeloyl-ACP methyl ester carboxylesterase
MNATEQYSIGPAGSAIAVPAIRAGKGSTVLFLSGAEPLRISGRWIAQLSEHHDVIMPIHPGFGGAPFVPHVRTPGDLAMIYLSLLDLIGDVTVIGSSFGGWIAAEMAVRSCQRVRRLVLLDGVGFKFGEPTQKEILDIYGEPTAEVRRALYHQEAFRNPDLSAATDETLTHIVEDRAAETYYAWSPYMHTPGLQHWLHRVTCPTLVLWGEHDGIVPPSYGEKIAQRIPGAQFAVVPNAAHYPHIENPGVVLERIQSLLKSR